VEAHTGGTSAVMSPPSASAAVTILQRVCLPLIEGADLQAIATPAGLRRKKDNGCCASTAIDG
jgi:hypothetical protein